MKNAIANVPLKGGLIGFLGDSPQRTLNRKLKLYNSKGYRVVQIIPSESGNYFLMLFRIFLLFITFGLYTTANGYYIVLERENGVVAEEAFEDFMPKSPLETIQEQANKHSSSSDSSDSLFD